MEAAIKNLQKKTSFYGGVVSRLPRSKDGWGNAQLVDGLLSGDPTAADALFDKYGEQINSRIWHLLGTDAEHDDLVQQVFVQLLDSIHALRNPDALGPWINKVLVNTVNKELRYRTRRRWLSFVAELPEQTLDATQERDMVMHQIRAVLQRMNATESLVFVMRYVEEAKMEEIATSFAWSLAKARRKVARSREVFLKKSMRNAVLASLTEKFRSER